MPIKKTLPAVSTVVMVDIRTTTTNTIDKSVQIVSPVCDPLDLRGTFGCQRDCIRNACTHFCIDC